MCAHATVAGAHQRERHDVVVRIHDQQQRRVLAALLDARRLRAPVEQHAEAARAVAPVLVAHLGAGRVDPRDFLDADRLVDDRRQESIAPQDRILPPQRRQAPHEPHLRGVLLRERPVDPGDLVVLAVGVVVAALRARELVAGEQHRRSLRQQQRREQVAHLPSAQLVDSRVVGLAFDAAIPRAIVGVAVVVVLAVRFVVPVVVRDEIVEREAIVRRHEIDARLRAAAVLVEDVGGAIQALRKRARRRLAAPVIPYGVAILVVPFGPAGRELADLVAAGPAIPRLGNQLYASEHRILRARLQEAAAIVEAVRLARENRAEIEPETVDVHLLHPVPQAVGDHLDHARVAQIQRVTRACVVDVVTLLVG